MHVDTALRDSANSPGSHMAPLGDPRLLLLVGVLALNDWWAKGQYANSVTGKLSDFVGPVVFTVLMSIAAGVVTGRSRARLVAVVTAVGFVSLKTIASVGAVAVAGLDAATPWQHTIVTDPTDVIGLVLLPLAVRIVERPIRWLDGRTARVAVAGAAGFVCLASSGPGPVDEVRLERVEDGGIVAFPIRDGEWGVNPEGRALDGDLRDWGPLDEPEALGVEVDRACLEACQPLNEDCSSDCSPVARGSEIPTCRIDQPTWCVRINDLERIEESFDGGDTWEVAWRFDADSVHARRTAGDYAGSQLQLTDIAVADDGTVAAVLAGTDGDFSSPIANADAVVIRWSDGSWSVPEHRFRPIPIITWGLISIFLLLTLVASSLVALGVHGVTRVGGALQILSFILTSSGLLFLGELLTDETMTALTGTLVWLFVICLLVGALVLQAFWVATRSGSRAALIGVTVATFVVLPIAVLGSGRSVLWEMLLVLPVGLAILGWRLAGRRSSEAEPTHATGSVSPAPLSPSLASSLFPTSLSERSPSLEPEPEAKAEAEVETPPLYGPPRVGGGPAPPMPPPRTDGVATPVQMPEPVVGRQLWALVRRGLGLAVLATVMVSGLSLLGLWAWSRNESPGYDPILTAWRVGSILAVIAVWRVVRSTPKVVPVFGQE